MEEHPAALKLRESRARIRSMLIPDPATGRIESQSFPRSALMRYAFDPRAHKLLMGALSLLMMYKGRRAVARAALWPAVVGSMGSLVRRLRRR